MRFLGRLPRLHRLDICKNIFKSLINCLDMRGILWFGRSNKIDSLRVCKNSIKKIIPLLNENNHCSKCFVHFLVKHDYCLFANVIICVK
jgi:hypothetical protein